MDVRKYEIFSGEIPRTPLTRGGVPPLVLSPNSCLRHSSNVFGISWPDHFSKADDGPENLPIYSPLKMITRRNTSSVGEMLDELEWPSLESRRERSSLTFFYKILSGTVSLDKDKYLTPAPNLRRTRASHESQYTRPFAYGDALKNSFSPRTIPVWNSLPSSVVLSKTIEEFKASI